MTPITPEWLEKIADEVEAYPTRWTRGTMACDENGNAVDAKNTAAKCWCINGFAQRDDVEVEDHGFLHFWSLVAKNDNLNSPAEFIAWLREMAAEMGVQA